MDVHVYGRLLRKKESMQCFSSLLSLEYHIMERLIQSSSFAIHPQKSRSKEVNDTPEASWGAGPELEPVSWLLVKGCSHSPTMPIN